MRGSAHPAGTQSHHRTHWRQREAVSHDRRGQRSRHRQTAGPACVRPLALRQQVPPTEAIARAAGHRHQCGRHVWPVDDRAANSRAQQSRQARDSTRVHDPHRHREEPAGSYRQADRMGQAARHRSRDRDGRRVPPWPALSARVPETDGGVESARQPDVRRTGRHGHNLRAQYQRAAARSRGDQTAPSWGRTRHSVEDDPRQREPPPSARSCSSDFSRVGPTVAKEICEKAGINRRRTRGASTPTACRSSRTRSKKPRSKRRR